MYDGGNAMTFLNYKKEKITSLLERMAAEFISKEGDFSSLVTVVGSQLSDSGRHINILISVLPETDEKRILELLSKMKKGYAKYVENRAKVSRMPSFDFKIDKGEKNRQIIEDII